MSMPVVVLPSYVENPPEICRCPHVFQSPGVCGIRQYAHLSDPLKAKLVGPTRKKWPSEDSEYYFSADSNLERLQYLLIQTPILVNKYL